jgi:carboxyl-terminal processing protease
MPKVWFLLAILMTCFEARASPATDFFAQVATLLNDNLVQQDKLEMTLNRFQNVLTQACETQIAQCPVNTGVNVTRAMLKELEEPHTVLHTPTDFSRLLNDIGGFQAVETGLGIITTRPLGQSTRVVLNVVSGSPSEAAGIRRGDRLLTVNGTVFPTVNDALSVNHPIHQAQEFDNRKLLEARVGEILQVQLFRYGVGKLSFTLVGAAYPAARLPMLHPIESFASFGILRIPSFTSSETANQVHALVYQAQARGITKLIVDLRENSGGRSNECVKAVGAFLPAVQRFRQNRRGSERDVFSDGQLRVFDQKGVLRELEVILQPTYWGGSVVVLVNEFTASCGEYFASELQWQARALVIGTETAGLGNSAAQLFPLVDGWGLQVTTSLTLHGDRSPFMPTVLPDIEIADAWEKLFEGQDIVLEKAVRLLQKN